MSEKDVYIKNIEKMSKVKLFLTKLSPYLGVVIFFLMLVILVFFFLFRTRLDVLSIYLSTISIIMVVGLYAIFVPFSFSYYLCLATVMLSPAFSILVWFINKRLLESPVPATVVLLVPIVIIIAHFKTYKKEPH